MHAHEILGFLDEYRPVSTKENHHYPSKLMPTLWYRNLERFDQGLAVPVSYSRWWLADVGDGDDEE